MSALLSNPTLIALFLAIIGGLGFGFHQRLAGAKAERNKRTEDRLKARDIADDIDDAVAGRAPATNREELKRWSK